MAKKVLFIGVALVMFAAPAGFLSAQAMSLLSEEFEGSFPPSGWSTSTSIGQNQWLRNDAWGRPNYTPGGNGYCADNDDAGAGPGAARVGNNILQSPTFDASGYQTVWLAYDVDWYPASMGMMGRVDVYNGTSWNSVKSFASGSRYTAHDSINISMRVAGVANARVRFYYTEVTGGVKSNWYEVDDVKVWGSDPPEPLDLQMAEIIRPKNWEKGGVPFKPSCRIYNNLDTTAHGTVHCRIKDMPTNEVVYTDVHTSHPLNTGYTVVEFKDFIPLKNKYYNAFFLVEHPDDVNPTNNDMNKNFSTHESEHDVTPYEMLSPQTPEQVNPFEPVANYAERLGTVTPAVMLLCHITNIEDEKLTYADTLSPLTFNQFDTLTAVFDTAILATGTYEIRFWATEPTGLNISNPPLVDTFNYTGIVETPIAARFGLDAVTPNPCIDFATIRFTLGHATNVTLRVYDAAGNVTATLVEDSRGAGSYTLNWNTSDVASGVYFVRMITPEFNATSKVMVLY